MSTIHKILKEVKKNTLKDSNEEELSRIRNFANMEQSMPDNPHFDAQTYTFPEGSLGQPDMKKLKPHPSDDVPYIKGSGVGFPRKKKD